MSCIAVEDVSGQELGDVSTFCLVVLVMCYFGGFLLGFYLTICVCMMLGILVPAA